MTFSHSIEICQTPVWQDSLTYGINGWICWHTKPHGVTLNINLKHTYLTHTQKGWNATTYDATIVTVEPRLLSTQLPPILLVFCDRQNDIGLYDKIVLLFQFVDSCPDASLFSSSLLCSYLYCIFKLWLTLVSSPSCQCCVTLEHRNHPSSIIGSKIPLMVYWSSQFSF